MAAAKKTPEQLAAAKEAAAKRAAEIKAEETLIVEQAKQGTLSGPNGFVATVATAEMSQALEELASTASSLVTVAQRGQSGWSDFSRRFMFFRKRGIEAKDKTDTQIAQEAALKGIVTAAKTLQTKIKTAQENQAKMGGQVKIAARQMEEVERAAAEAATGTQAG